MSKGLRSITQEQHEELREMLDRLGRLWLELTVAASNKDQRRVEDIQAEIAVCRNWVEHIKGTGTRGLA